MAIGPLIGALGGLLGGLQQQNAQKDMAQDQMEFQAWMSNTAYQRAVDDLKRAGLNPMLAYRQPSSSPGGASGAMENISNSAAQAASAAANIQNVAATTEKTKAETAKIEEETLTEQLERRANMRAQTGLYTSSANQAESQAAVNREQMFATQNMVEQIAAQTHLTREQANLSVAQRQLVYEQAKNATIEFFRIAADLGLKVAERNFTIAKTGIAKVDELLKRYELPMAKRLAEVWEHDPEKRAVGPWLKEIEIGATTATRLLNPLRIFNRR